VTRLFISTDGLSGVLTLVKSRWTIPLRLIHTCLKCIETKAIDNKKYRDKRKGQSLSGQKAFIQDISATKRFSYQTHHYKTYLYQYVYVAKCIGYETYQKTKKPINLP
jgi:hypothetical protein